MLGFLADESCDFSVVRVLRGGGFDVISVAECASGSTDEDVIRMAREGGRIVLTEDRDFGRLVFAAAWATSGVIYIRYPVLLRPQLPGRVLRLVQREGQRLEMSFTVVRPHRVRIRTLP
ncbi:MAG: DUF5615 family PIN-like protein [Burkholderiales bacterium]|nr:DUF5615 family PIN-like protein [Burkholderiales bacterium]